jgi:2-dehydropantoate 2-reductase
MKFVFIGAGAMGSNFGGQLARAGYDVTLVDTWSEHVRAIEANGLELQGVLGEHRIPIAASVDLVEEGQADVAVVFTDTNATAAAAETARRALKADGVAMTFQNGIGNLEKIEAAVGSGRVIGGSSMCSGAMKAPGTAVLTHLGPNSIGEIDGGRSARLNAIGAALEKAGFTIEMRDDIVAKIWNKFVLNAGINALCATAGLRLGEMARLAEMSALQDRILDEALAVVDAKGINLPDSNIRDTIKRHCWLKFSRPSMMQHIDAGRATEIDAINGAIVREGRSLGIPTPYNEALVALLKGRELSQQRRMHEPDIDYDALEAEARESE